MDSLFLRSKDECEKKTDDAALKAWTYKTTVRKCYNLRRNSWFKKRTNLTEDEIFMFPTLKSIQ